MSEKKGMIFDFNGTLVLDSHIHKAVWQDFFPEHGRPALTDEEAEKNRQSQWKRRGILLKDEDVLLAMDPNEQSKRLSCTIKKDGTISGDSADREQLDDLETYVFRVVGKMVDEIASGNMRVYKDGEIVNPVELTKLILNR